MTIDIHLCDTGNHTHSEYAYENETMPFNLRILHSSLSISNVVLGFLGNIIVIIAVVKSKLHREAANILLLNLCTNNIIVASVFIPFFTIQSFSGSWLPVYGFTGCKAMAYLMYSFLGAEIFGLVLITINRYILISHYARYQDIYKHSRYIAIMLISSWSLHPLALILPLTELWGHFSYDPFKLVCHPFNIDSSFRFFIVASTMLISVPAFMYCYAKILFTFWKSRRKINVLRSMSSQVEKNNRKHEIQTVMSVFFVLLCFFICYVPYFAVTLSGTTRCELGVTFSIASTYIAFCHCWVNPTIYAIMNPQIKAAIKELVQCL